MNPSGVPIVASDYWPQDVLSSDIAVKEALALCNVLRSFMSSVKDSRVDVYVDSSALLHAWNNQSARSHSFSAALKSIFQVVLTCNCSLRLYHIPSALNVADGPSRTLSLSDSRLSKCTWKLVQDSFGGPLGHTVDLMALPSNAMLDICGSRLPFFSPWPTPGCQGVNVFSQLADLHPPWFVLQCLRFSSDLPDTQCAVLPLQGPSDFFFRCPRCSSSSLLVGSPSS